MSDTLTLEQRLRSWDRCWPGNINIEMAINEAADELARLSTELAEARNALREIANEPEVHTKLNQERLCCKFQDIASSALVSKEPRHAA